MLVCYIAITAMLIKIFTTFFPYHVLLMNKLYINMLVIRIWVAIILILARTFDYTDQDDLFGLSMLIFISPTLLLYTNHRINLHWFGCIMKRKQFSHLWQLEHMIRAEVLQMKLSDQNAFDKKYEISDNLDQAFKAGYNCKMGNTTDFQLYLAHIMVKIGRLEFVKKILGTLSSEIRPTYLVEIQRCRTKLYNKIIAKHKNEIEIIKYIEFQKERELAKYMEQMALENEY